MDANTAVDLYVDAWNKHDADRRAQMLEDSFSETGTYTDPRYEVSGRQALIEHINGFEERFPGVRMERRSKVDGYGDVLRFAWAMVGEDDSLVLEGVDFVVLGEDAKIRSVTGFFGALD